MDAPSYFLFGVLPLLHKRVGVGFVGDAPADHLPPFFRSEGAVDLHGQTKPVQQLGTQVTFFGVHGAHQDEIGGVTDGDPLPLHVVAAHGGGVQKNVHQMVVQEVYLVHVEDASMRGGNQARFKAAVARLDGLFDIQ